MRPVDSARTRTVSAARRDGETGPAGAAREPRRRGRPPSVPRAAVIAQIRELAARGDGLFRVHRTHPDLYARARRFFGSWAEAVIDAGLDYASAIRTARARSRIALRRRPRDPARPAHPPDKGGT